jgi:hypothetical protein
LNVQTVAGLGNIPPHYRSGRDDGGDGITSRAFVALARWALQKRLEQVDRRVANRNSVRRDGRLVIIDAGPSAHPIQRTHPVFK